MKKISLIFSALLLLAGTEMISCNSSAEKVEKAEDEVKVANENLDEANSEYLADIEKFRLETNEKIDENGLVAWQRKLDIKKYKQHLYPVQELEAEIDPACVVLPKLSE